MKKQVKFSLLLLLSTVIVGSISACEGGFGAGGGGAGRKRSASDVERDELALDNRFAQSPAQLREARILYNRMAKEQAALFKEIAQEKVSAKDTAKVKPGVIARTTAWAGARFANKTEGIKTITSLLVLGGAGYLGREHLGSAVRVVSGSLKGAATGAVAGARGDKR